LVLYRAHLVLVRSWVHFSLKKGSYVDGVYLSQLEGEK